MNWKTKAWWRRLFSLGRATGEFSDRARAALTLAAICSRLCESAQVDDDHLLMGLLEQDAGLHAILLESCGCNRKAMARELKDLLGVNRPLADEPVTEPRPPLSAHARSAMSAAVREAHELDHFYVTTAHLVLGLLKNGEGPMAEFLRAYDLDFAAARRAVQRAMHHGQAIAAHETWPGDAEFLTGWSISVG